MWLACTWEAFFETPCIGRYYIFFILFDSNNIYLFLGMLPFVRTLWITMKINLLVNKLFEWFKYLR